MQTAEVKAVGIASSPLATRNDNFLGWIIRLSRLWVFINNINRSRRGFVNHFWITFFYVILERGESHESHFDGACEKAIMGGKGFVKGMVSVT